MQYTWTKLSKLLSLVAVFCLIPACGYQGAGDSGSDGMVVAQKTKEPLTEETFFKRGVGRHKIRLRVAPEPVVNGSSGYGLYAYYRPIGRAASDFSGQQSELVIRLCGVKDDIDAQLISRISAAVEEVGGAYITRANDLPDISANAPGAYFVTFEAPRFPLDSTQREKERQKLLKRAVVVSMPMELNQRNCSLVVDVDEIKRSMRPKVGAANAAPVEEAKKKKPTLDDIAKDPSFSE